MGWGECVCGHGYGLHNSRDVIRVQTTGEVLLFSDESQPQACDIRSCDCLRFKGPRARWSYTKFDGRKACWLSTEEVPVCGKTMEITPRIQGPQQSNYSSKCVGCKRWLDEHPDALNPDIPLEVVEAQVAV